MSYVLFKVKKEDRSKVDTALKIDIISRQSITVRDGEGLGLDESTYVLIEGSDEAVAEAKKAFDFAEIPENSQEIYRKLKEQEDDAASGMGLIFG